jgi:hypothetical protein
MILLLDARVNATPPPQKKLGDILEKIYLFKILFLKTGVNKWMQLVVLPNKKHSWPKKGIPSTPKVKKIINDGS